MTLRIPNRTAQTGVFKTGSPNYVDVSSGTAVASMVTFSAKATDDSWADSDTVGVAITKNASNYKVWLASWDETNEYLELVTEEESVGTISDTDAVTVTAVLTQGTIEDTLNLAANSREVLTADRTYYVRTDGSDSNDGLTDSAGGAFLTIQKAVNVVCINLDMKGYQVTIQVGNGTYTGSVTLYRYVGTLAPILQGDTTTPSNVIISTTSATCISFVTGNAVWVVKGFKLTTATSGNSIACTTSGSTLRLYNIDFGASAGYHMIIQFGGQIVMEANYSITGSASYHLVITDRGEFICSGKTVTITGTPSLPFIYATRLVNILLSGNTYTGSATGKRYDLNMLTSCFVNGAGTTYLPGNSAGTTATGAQYA